MILIFCRTCLSLIIKCTPFHCLWKIPAPCPVFLEANGVFSVWQVYQDSSGNILCILFFFNPQELTLLMDHPFKDTIHCHSWLLQHVLASMPSILGDRLEMKEWKVARHSGEFGVRSDLRSTNLKKYFYFRNKSWFPLRSSRANIACYYGHSNILFLNIRTPWQKTKGEG